MVLGAAPKKIVNLPNGFEGESKRCFLPMTFRIFLHSVGSPCIFAQLRAKRSEKMSEFSIMLATLFF
eukprot:239944-Pyramimonas_sp.AAC.1